MTYQDFCSVLDRAPDADQERVIRSLQNTIVSAGAGSGKTQTLASRFAYLITADLTDQDGKPMANPTVDRILTLTFTKKAAAEMYQRIYQTLKIFAQKSPDSAGKKRAQDAIDNFSKARIQTLDSYNVSVLRQAAPLYGIRPDFAPGADSLKTKGLAFDFVMENRNNPAVQWISDPARLEDCAALFADAASQNASLASSINKERKCSVFAESLERQKKFAKKKWLLDNPLLKIEETIEQLKEVFPEERPRRYPDWHDKIKAALDAWDSDAARDARDFVKNFVKDEEVFLDSQKLFELANSKECLTAKKALLNFDISNKIGDEETSNLVNNVLFGRNKDAAGLAKEFVGMISFFADLKFLEGLHPLLDSLTDKVNALKRANGELTFKDTNELALLVLKEQEALRKQERDAFDFIMIDEFQDNNAANRDLLLLISKDDDKKIMKNRLFFVGDEKQSIYKFRGADVSVFNSLDKYIEPCVKLPMRNNYRSSDILIDGFNQIFGGYLPSDGDEATIPNGKKKIFKSWTERDYEAKFDASARALFPKTKTAEKKDGARIQICLYSSEGSDKDARLDESSSKALYVAKKILSLHENKGVAFKDIALLVKSRTRYSEIARIFSLNKIPFTLDQQDKIFTQCLANDFYSALRLCVYPADINAFATFLNSPFTGMSLEETEKVLSLFPAKAFDPEINTEGVLSEDEAGRYREAESFFKDLAEFALSSPIADSIDRLWQKEGYKFTPDANEEHYDLLYELARKADADSRDLSWFVDQLALLRDKYADEDSELDIKESNYPVEKSDCVNVMTIHKSKGLQFDYVFVWGIAESRSGGGESSKIFQSEEFGAVVANGKTSQNLFAILAGVEDGKKEEEEFRRLIYVALTRAIKGLFIVGRLPSKKSSDQPMLALLLEYMDSETPPPYEIEEMPLFLRGSERPAESQGQKSLEETRAAYQSAKTIERTPAKNFWTTPSGLEEKETAAGTESQAASHAYPEINSFVNDSALAKNEYGSLFHAFMEDWARNFADWKKESVEAEKYFERNPLTRKISAQNQKTLLETFFKILEKFISQKDNPAADALRDGRPFKAEYRFKTKISSYIINGTMDAVFQNSDGSWTVLDYKTDLNERPEIYKNQLACYKKTAADLFADGDQDKVKCLLFFAETGNFVDVSEEAQKALDSLNDEKIRNLIEKAEIL
ncbi:MAG: UvrD-helicase domain-containing protein [Treponema sp.]|nr:UvrD-helicase domain-containing protein [Treponema sp.]